MGTLSAWELCQHGNPPARGDQVPPTTAPPWAKWDSSQDQLSLLSHSADVAACTVALLEHTLLGRRLARLGGGSELSDVQRDRLGYLAALHDFGKAGVRFQRQILPGEPKAGHVKQALALLDLDIGGYEPCNRFYELLPTEELSSWAADPESVTRLLIATVCHHGRPYTDRPAPSKDDWQAHHGIDPFVGLAELLTAARGWFPQAFAESRHLLPEDAAFQHAWNGVLNLADWLASSQEFFPFRGHLEAGLDRMTYARQQADRVLRWVGLDTKAARRLLESPPKFAQISDKPSPRPAQAIMGSLAPDAAGSLTILEASTGSGKTEAALWHFARLFQAGLVDGMTFALPTRTAATQIEGRLETAIKRLFPGDAQSEQRPPVVLAVPGYLRVDGVIGRALGHFETHWDDEDPKFRRRAWAGEHAKRYLAGGIVAGTVDQVLLSTLQVRHAHLRAACLLRHLLVVDEVHASDDYMTRLLEEVLAHHRGAGGHALLMSATLGATARQRFLHRSGTSPSLAPPSLAAAIAAPYPLVSFSGHSTSAVHELAVDSFAANEANHKHVDVELAPLAAAPIAVARLALEAAKAGARVLVVRNTVQECREVQAALVSMAQAQNLEHLLFGVLNTTSGHHIPAPHHGRFAPSDRRRLDEAIEQEFQPSAERSGGLVAVATQTVEQSLDLDADLLLTDLCPMDVLLQRIGRLHRHRTTRRPTPFEVAKVIVLVPADRELQHLLRDSGTAHGQHGLGNVYPDLRVIECTWRQLEAHSSLVLPTMCRELVERSTHPEALNAVGQGLKEAWRQHAKRIGGRQYAERGVAKLNIVDWAKPFGEEAFGSDERDIATRLGDRDLILPVPEGPIGPFGDPVTQLNLRAYDIQGLVLDDEPKAEPTEPLVEGGFRFVLGRRAFIYDSIGLT